MLHFTKEKTNYSRWHVTKKDKPLMLHFLDAYPPATTLLRQWRRHLIRIDNPPLEISRKVSRSVQSREHVPGLKTAAYIPPCALCHNYCENESVWLVDQPLSNGSAHFSPPPPLQCATQPAFQHTIHFLLWGSQEGGVCNLWKGGQKRNSPFIPQKLLMNVML